MRTTSAAALGLVVLAAATACGGSTTTSLKTAPTTSAAPTSAAPTKSPISIASALGSPSPSASAGAAGGAAFTGTYTPTNTKLAFGAKAIVPFEGIDANNNKTMGAEGITVTGITKGTNADLAPLMLGDQVAGATPYYINVSISDESGTDFSFTALNLTDGEFADGTEAQRVSVIGDFAPCPNNTAPKSFTTTGATYTTCVLVLSQSTQDVTTAAYVGEPYDDIPNAPDYGLTGLTWSAS